MAVALESDFRATGRVVRQPASIPRFLRQQLLGRQVPRVNLGVVAATGNEQNTVIAIDVDALVRRLEHMLEIGDEYLYYRVDNASSSTMHWAYFLNGEWQRAGPRSRRFGGRPVNVNQEPTSRDSTPRVSQGEPGWRAVGAESLNQLVDSRAIEQHLPHVWANVRGAFRSRYTMPVRNALENLNAELRRTRADRSRLYDDYEHLRSQSYDVDNRHADEVRNLTSENQRLRNERNAERQAAQVARAEVERQARTIEALLGRNAAVPMTTTVPSPGATPNPYGGGATYASQQQVVPPRQTITQPRSSRAPGAHYRADPFAAPPRSPQSPGGY